MLRRIRLILSMQVYILNFSFLFLLFYSFYFYVSYFYMLLPSVFFDLYCEIFHSHFSVNQKFFFLRDFDLRIQIIGIRKRDLLHTKPLEGSKHSL